MKDPKLSEAGRALGKKGGPAKLKKYGKDAYKHFIQKIDKGEEGIGFRFCYYTLDSAKTKIVFGQYASQMGESDFKEFIAKAKEKGFF